MVDGVLGRIFDILKVFFQIKILRRALQTKIGWRGEHRHLGTELRWIRLDLLHAVCTVVRRM